MHWAAQGVVGTVVTILTACSVIYGSFWCLLSLRYLQVAYSFGGWDYFALFYTFATPAVSVGGYFVFWFRPSLKTAAFPILASLLVGGIYWVWAPGPFN